MGATNIEWSDVVWNPLAGCTRASVGCDNCYAAKMSLRLEAMALADIAAGKDPGGKAKYIGIATKSANGVPAFNGVINLDENELQRPYTWKKPRMVFVNSMSDLFHKDVPERFILSAFNVMRDNPKHVFQVLTKRPGRAADFTSRLTAVPKNVWMGTSVENQEQADKRIPELLKIPAAVRFLSMEPLLEKVSIAQIDGVFYDGGMPFPWQRLENPGINWVIVGGESGHGKRPFNVDWALQLQVECQLADVPFFMKQIDKVQPVPEDLMIREMPKVLA